MPESWREILPEPAPGDFSDDDGEIKDEDGLYMDREVQEARDSIRLKIFHRVGRLLQNPQHHGHTRLEEKISKQNGKLARIVSSWATWDGKPYVQQFALPSIDEVPFSATMHQDHTKVTQLQTFVKTHWGLPREKESLGLALEENEAELAHTWREMNNKLRDGLSVENYQNFEPSPTINRTAAFPAARHGTHMPPLTRPAGAENFLKFLKRAPPTARTPEPKI